MITWLFKICAWCLKPLPWAWIYPLGKRLGTVAFEHSPVKQQVLYHNLATLKSDEEKKSVAQKIFQNYATYYLEILKIGPHSKNWFSQNLKVEGIQHLTKALKLGHGAIVITAHFGNWDLAGFALVLQGFKVAAVAEKLNPPSLFRWFCKIRKAMGMQVIGLDSQTNRRCFAHLKENGVLALVADRDLTKNGLPLPFMGQVVSLPKGPAQLALRSGAAVLPGYLIRQADGTYLGHLNAPLKLTQSNDFENDVTANTRLMSQALEEIIRTDLSQWCMLQPIAYGQG